MRIHRVIGACVLLAAFATLGSAAGRQTGAAPAASGVAWRTDHDQAMSLARKERRPVLIDFMATWCKPCRDMETQLWSRPDVVPLTEKFVCLLVDVDRQPGIARRYRADSLPMLVLTDPWGEELARREGFGSPDPYLTMLREMPGDFSEIAPLHERVAARPRDAQALHDIGMAYQHLKLYERSTEYLESEVATSEIRGKPEMLAEALTVIGWNRLRMGDLRQARRSFERCLKEVPSHQALDATVYGLFASHLMEGDRKKAEPILRRLESCCPGSTYVERAREDLKAPPAAR